LYRALLFCAAAIAFAAASSFVNGVAEAPYIAGAAICFVVLAVWVRDALGSAVATMDEAGGTREHQRVRAVRSRQEPDVRAHEPVEVRGRPRHRLGRG
jgi:hypothetical protein